MDKIEPAFLVEEKLEYLIIGDVIEEEKIPSPKIKDWVIKFSELSKRNQLIIKSVSYYYVTSTNIESKSLWINFLQENNFFVSIYPPFLKLKLKESGFNLEDNAFKSVKDYSNDFIEFCIKNKRGI